MHFSSFIFSKINTFGHPKFSKKSLHFFRPYPCVINGLFKGHPNHPSGRFCVWNHISKNVSEKYLGGVQPPEPPLVPPMVTILFL